MKKITLLLIYVAFNMITNAQDVVTVTSNADSGPGTLRELIENASFDNSTEIRFASDMTIILDGGLFIQERVSNNDEPETFSNGRTRDIIIDGQDHLIVIDGNGASRPFSASKDCSLEIKNVTIQNGKTNGNGGAIQSAGNLLLVNCILANNEANNRGGAVYVTDSNLDLVNCLFKNNTLNQINNGMGSAICNLQNSDNDQISLITNIINLYICQKPNKGYR